MTLNMRTPMLVLSCVLPLLITIACSQEAERHFPDIASWSKTVTPEQYKPENLWDFIDGAAEIYLSYGFEDLSLAEYTHASAIAIRVEVYRHRSHADAFGIYAQERNPSYRFIDVGTQGYIEEGVVNFLAGTYYVKLTTHESGTEAQDALLLIAHAMDRHLAQPHGWPMPLRLFPERGRILNSETYIAESFLGYPELRSAYVAEYDSLSPYKVYLLIGDASGRSPHPLNTLLRAVARDDARPVPESTVVRVDDPNNGPLYVIKVGVSVAGTLDCREEERARRVLEDFAARLSKTLR